MSSLNRGHWKTPNRVKGLLVVALGCLLSANGFAQLIYLTDTRSVSGSASVSDVSQYNSTPYFTTSYTGNYSGSNSPSSPFADFNGNIDGTATLQGGLNLSGGQQPMTISSTVTSSQVSFLHSTELYFSSFEGSSGMPVPGPGAPSTQWSGQGDSVLEVTFQVLDPTMFNLSIEGTGDPVASDDFFSLTSSGQGTLASGNTEAMLQHGQYGVPIDFSGTFTPGNTYTLTLDSQGTLDGGGLRADLTVPEPSMTALAGLAFVVFLLRVRQINQRAVVPVRVRTERVERPSLRSGAPRG